MTTDSCTWPSGQHFWSVPNASGRQTCLWCPAVREPEPIDGQAAGESAHDGYSGTAPKAGG